MIKYFNFYSNHIYFEAKFTSNKNKIFFTLN